jgi:hypothetical protein
MRVTKLFSAKEESESIIEEASPMCSPSAITIISKVDEELAELDAREARIGYATESTKAIRKELLRRRSFIEQMVN